MHKPYKEELEHYLCEIGMVETMLLFSITEEYIDKMLNVPAVGESDRFTFKEPKEYSAWEAVETEDTIQLARVISENYDRFRKKRVFKKWNINTRSLSQEDVYHNTLISVLRSSKGFRYVSDKETIKYISHGFKMNQNNAIINSILAAKMNESFITYFDEDLSEIQITEENSLLELLTPAQKVVAEFLEQGFTVEDISIKLNKSTSSIYRIKDSIKTTLKNNLK